MSEAAASWGGPLAGLRVIDLTRVLAGPLASQFLGDLGAEILKIEPPGKGDETRGFAPFIGGESHYFIGLNRGKRSLVIDLRQPDGAGILRGLVATADVLIENFRPGVMDRLGLGYEILKKANPKLVYCAISGFGQGGPMRHAPAYDQIVQGMSGVMSITGDHESAPLRVGYPVADTIGGITAAFAVAAALVRQSRSGEGEFIDVSMLDSTIVTMGWIVSNYLIAGKEPVPMGNENFTAAPSGTFRTGEGLLNIAANKQEQFVALAEAIGRPELATDERFAERETRKRNRKALKVEVEAGLAGKSAAEWESILAKLGVPAGRVLSVPQVLAHPQIQSRDLLAHFEQVPGVGRDISLVRAGFKMAGGNPDVATPPPQLGEHTDSLLVELGYSAAEIAQLHDAKAV